MKGRPPRLSGKFSRSLGCKQEVHFFGPQQKMVEDEAVEAMFDAVREGDERAVARLLDAHPPLRESTNWLTYITPLIEASGRGHLTVVKVLISRGADVGATCYLGFTALHWAAKRGHEEILELLLSRGAGVRSRTMAGRTPIMDAADKGHARVVARLLEIVEPEEVDEREDNGCTALRTACEKGHVAIVGTLLKAGADPTIACNQGITPRMAAAAGGHTACVALVQVRMTLLFQPSRNWSAHGSSTIDRETLPAPSGYVYRELTSLACVYMIVAVLGGRARAGVHPGPCADAPRGPQRWTPVPRRPRQPGGRHAGGQAGATAGEAAAAGRGARRGGVSPFSKVGGGEGSHPRLCPAGHAPRALRRAHERATAHLAQRRLSAVAAEGRGRRGHEAMRAGEGPGDACGKCRGVSRAGINESGNGEGLSEMREGA